MGLGERCDEIVRLIDDTLAGLGVDPEPAPADAPLPATTAILQPRWRARTWMGPDPEATGMVS